jgi:hypothetical protein
VFREIKSLYAYRSALVHDHSSNPPTSIVTCIGIVSSFVGIRNGALDNLFGIAPRGHECSVGFQGKLNAATERVAGLYLPTDESFDGCRVRNEAGQDPCCVYVISEGEGETGSKKLVREKKPNRCWGGAR